MHFSYEKPREEAIKEMKNFLVNEEFTILEFAPEDGFILTDYKSFDWGEGRRLLAVSVHIHDKMTINGMGKMDIPVSGIGEDEELLKIKTFDRNSKNNPFVNCPGGQSTVRTSSENIFSKQYPNDLSLIHI